MENIQEMTGNLGWKCSLSPLLVELQAGKKFVATNPSALGKAGPSGRRSPAHETDRPIKAEVRSGVYPWQPSSQNRR